MGYSSSKNAAPQLDAVTSTSFFCVDLHVQIMLLEIAADIGCTIYGGDATDTYAHSLFLFIHLFAIYGFLPYRYIYNYVILEHCKVT